jgi:hypothetical protein
VAEPAPIEASAQAPTVRLELELAEAESIDALEQATIHAQRAGDNGARINAEPRLERREPSAAGELPPT